MSPELAELEAMLERLRVLRNRHSWGEVRQAYNAAFDRLDVLCCRVHQAQRQPVIRLRGFWSRVWDR